MTHYEFQDYKLYDVSGFEIVGAYTLRVIFDDGTEQIIDFEPILLGPIFGPLRNQTLFNQVKLDPELGTLVWPTGADIDPTVLHDWPEHVEAIIKRRKQFVITVKTLVIHQATDSKTTCVRVASGTAPISVNITKA